MPCTIGLPTSVADLGDSLGVVKISAFLFHLQKGKCQLERQIPIKALLLLDILQPGSRSAKNKIK